MPTIIGGSNRVVDDGQGLTIDELAGNVATKDDRISIAHVNVAAKTAEPWLTLHYDEWICVLKGKMLLKYENGAKELEVKAGDTVFIKEGERFKPEFPYDGGCEYVPVCLPAFRPDRCIREDDTTRGEEVSVKLKTLHGGATDANPNMCKPSEEKPDTLYHMCVKADWEAAVKSGEAYFPPTFEKDGFYTHATAVPVRLIETANHFYTSSVGDWVCLKMSRAVLRSKFGIHVRDEEAMPVGDTAVGDSWNNWVCPHIVGGIPPAVVDTVLSMERTAEGKFVSIEGVDETTGV